MCDNIEINIKEKKGPVIVIDAIDNIEQYDNADQEYDHQEYIEMERYLADDDCFFDKDNMHYIWKPVVDNWGTTRYESKEYWLKTPEGIVKKRLRLVRTM